jgi:hypothetical protein
MTLTSYTSEFDPQTEHQSELPEFERLLTTTSQSTRISFTHSEHERPK